MSHTMGDTISEINKARGSAETHTRHPCVYDFHPEARLINHQKCRWLIDEIWTSGFHAHEAVISVTNDDKRQVLLGGAHRCIASMFNFTMVTEKVVSSDRAKDGALLRMVQFSEPVSTEWQTIAQTVLFAHFLDGCETTMSAVDNLQLFLGRKRREGMDMRHMLFANRFKSASSVKRFVKGVRTLTDIGWLDRLERLEARNKIKWNATHILSIGLLGQDRVKEILEETNSAGDLVGTKNPFYEEYKVTKKTGAKRVPSSSRNDGVGRKSHRSTSETDRLMSGKGPFSLSDLSSVVKMGANVNRHLDREEADTKWRGSVRSMINSIRDAIEDQVDAMGVEEEEGGTDSDKDGEGEGRNDSGGHSGNSTEDDA